MNRRNLFKSLLGVALFPLAKQAHARAGMITVLIQESPLAGYQYHYGEALWDELRTGQPLDLVREPDNTYDNRAVRVDWKGKKLGYVPRLENTAVSQMLDRGERLTARIAGLQRTANPWKRITIRIHLESTWHAA